MHRSCKLLKLSDYLLVTLLASVFCVNSCTRNRSHQFLQIVVIEDGKSSFQLTNTEELKTSLSWSPDGRDIAFNGIRRTKAETDYRTTIFKISATQKRSNPQPIFSTEGSCFSLDWSPDGEKIVFALSKDYHLIDEIYPLGIYPIYTTQLWTVGSDGSNSEQLTFDTEEDVNPAWSPDGRQIAFSRRVSDIFSLCLINVEDKKVDILETSTEQSYSFIRWSPDGRKIVYVSEGEIWISLMEPPRRKVRITHGNWLPYQAGIKYYDPDWSPNGAELVCIGEREDPLGTSLESNIKQITLDGREKYSPRWSPDGNRIAYISKIEGESKGIDLYLIEVPSDVH